MWPSTQQSDPAAEQAAWDVARRVAGLLGLRRAVELAAQVGDEDVEDAPTETAGARIP